MITATALPVGQPVLLRGHRDLGVGEIVAVLPPVDPRSHERVFARYVVKINGAVRQCRRSDLALINRGSRRSAHYRGRTQ